MRQLLILVLIVMACSVVSCKKKETAIIPKPKMEQVLWDFIRADVYTYQYLKKDSLVKDSIENIKLQNKIFRNYKISREQFETSLEYYLQRPKEINEILDSIISRQSKPVQTNKIKELKDL